MAEFLDPNWQSVAVIPSQFPDMPGTYDSALGRWVAPDEPMELTTYEGDPQLAYEMAVAQSQANVIPFQQPPTNVITMPVQVIPGDPGGYVASLRTFAMAAFGSAEPGAVVRVRSALVNEPSGVRPGVLPRVQIPVSVRKSRGVPL